MEGGLEFLKGRSRPLPDEEHESDRVSTLEPLSLGGAAGSSAGGPPQEEDEAGWSHQVPNSSCPAVRAQDTFNHKHRSTIEEFGDRGGMWGEPEDSLGPA